MSEPNETNVQKNIVVIVECCLFLGPSQPDEDDYGYVSQEASAFYNQLMSKYNNTTPQKTIFNDCRKKTIKDIASTKV